VTNIPVDIVKIFNQGLINNSVNVPSGEDGILPNIIAPRIMPRKKGVNRLETLKNQE
jgi:hypothetical protein